MVLVCYRIIIDINDAMCIQLSHYRSCQLLVLMNFQHLEMVIGGVYNCMYVRDIICCISCFLKVDSYCYKGQCESHDNQCKLLWGRTGRMSNRLCFEHFNVMGTANGHCGFNWVDGKSFQKCELRSEALPLISLDLCRPLSLDHIYFG